MAPTDEFLSENCGASGLLCADCGAPQYITRSGPTCRNGHGGSEGVYPEGVEPPAPVNVEAMTEALFAAAKVSETSWKSTKYKPCERCAEARASGDFDQAIACSFCKGRGVVRTRDSWVCNGCGGCMCPGKDGEMNGDCPHGLVDASVTGGYSSEHLSDMTAYTFSLCEKCLRDAFTTFKIPPKTAGYGFNGEDDDEEPYAKEVADKAAYEARSAEEKRIFQHFVETDRCTDTNRVSGEGPFCGERAAGVIDCQGSRWPRCVRHMRDSYVHTHIVLEVPGRRIAFEENAAIGRLYLAWFEEAQKGGAGMLDRPEPKDEHAAAVFLSTLFSLVMDPATFHLANAELCRLGCSLPPKAPEWEHIGVAAKFPPHMAAEASAANDWLAWGRKEGYVNAVAHPLVRRSAKSLWKIEEVE